MYIFSIYKMKSSLWLTETDSITLNSILNETFQSKFLPVLNTNNQYKLWVGDKREKYEHISYKERYIVLMAPVHPSKYSSVINDARRQ